MAPRRYDRSRRDQARAETRRRILDAVIALHAERGVRATSYAAVAERADVAVATVHNHFPDLGGILEACISDVGASAPPLDPAIFTGCADLRERLEALVRALFARHRFLAPWLRWGQHEAHLVPELAPYLQGMQEEQRRFILAALAPELGPAPPPPLLAMAELLLGFAAWQQLTAAGGPVEAAVGDALEGLVRRRHAHHPAVA
jgi:AcrR family transcriptional regulator